MASCGSKGAIIAIYVVVVYDWLLSLGDEYHLVRVICGVRD